MNYGAERHSSEHPQVSPAKLSTTICEQLEELHMPRSIPDTSTLLSKATRYLEQDLMPTLSGYHRFQTRVTINVLNIVRRELELREAHESAEYDRLTALIGHDGPIDSLNHALCEMIRSAGIDSRDPNLWAHIRQSLAEALSINNPKWTAG